MRNVGLKKLYVGFIALALVAVIPAMPAKAETLGDFEYEVVEGNVRITKYSGTETEVTVPETIDDKLVTEIGSDAFYTNEVITKVELPEGIVVIGGYAFAACNNLATINFPSTVETIEVSAFQNCSSLSGVVLPNKLKKIGNGAFHYCEKITEIVFPAGLETIGQNAFSNTSLWQVCIPDSVTYIGSNAFLGTPWLNSQIFVFGKKNVVVKNHLLWCECPNNGKAVVPEGVTYIPEFFFVHSLVSTIVLPNSLKEIERGAFAQCENLSSIVIPSEVTSIGMDAFESDFSLNFIFYPEIEGGFANLSFSNNTTAFLYSIKDNKAVIGRIDKLGEKTEITVPSEISGYTVAFSDDVKTKLKEIGIKINHTHVGGTPTCTKEAVCLICGEEYFAPHEYSVEWTTDGTNHWHECTACGHKNDISAHTGGNATCTQLAVCSICDEEYGEFAHKYSTEWTTDGTSHWHECTACGHKKDISDHTLKTTTTKATLTTDGKLETKCSVCNKITKTTPIYAASNISLLKDTAAYTGKTQKPKAVVKDSKGNAINASYYTLSLPTGLKKVGSYKVKVTLKGDLYEGSKTLTFKINPAKTKLSSVKAGSKSMTLKWAKKTTEVTGYEIRYSLKKDLKGAKSVIVKSAKSTSKEIKKLKAKKTYYVQIRTYKTVKGKKYYSDWSATKKVKIK